MSIQGYEIPGELYMGSEDEMDLYTGIIDDLDSAWVFFEPKQQKAAKNINYVSNNQWTREEKAAHRKMHRNAYAFNEVSRIVDSLIGTQNQTRLDSKLLPREKGDEASVELLSFLMKWVEQANDIEYTETEVFRDAIIKSFGVTEVTWNDENISYGFPEITKVPMNEIMWDCNSVKLDLSDSRWMSRQRLMTKLDAIEAMPWAKKVIEEASTVADYGSSHQNKWSIDTVKQKRSKLGSPSLSMKEKRGLIRVIEYYEKAKSHVYIVADAIKDDVNVFDNHNDALSFQQGLISGYSETQEDLYLPDGSEAIVLRQESKDVFFQTIIVGSKVASHKVTSLPNFPWIVCFSYFDDGDFWGFVDAFIDRQDMLNRMVSQLDYQLGASSKSAITVMDNHLKRGFGIDKLQDEWSKTSAIIPVLNHDAIRAVPNQPVNPEYFNMSQWLITGINDAGGGKNVMGLQESANESGRAVIARAEQAGLGRLPFFDKLRLWRKQVTAQIVWYIKNYMTPSQIVRIIGVDPEVSFTLVDDNGILNTLQEMNYDIQIDEAVKNASIKERQFQQMKELFALIQAPAEIVTPVMIEYSDIPLSKKQELLSYMDFYKEYIQSKAAMQKQQQMEQAVQDQFQKAKMRELLANQEEIKMQAQGVEKDAKTLQTKLNDVEKLRQKLAEEQSSPQQAASSNATLQNAEEIGERPGAQMQGMMGVSGS